MFNRIRNRSFEKRIAKYIASHKRSRLLHDFNSAKLVAIVVQLSDVKTLDQVIGFKSYIESFGAKVSLLVFNPSKVIETDFLLRKDVDIIDCKSVNWLSIPISPIVNSFTATKFDMLIDLSLNEIRPIRWISATSIAQFKIGIVNYPDNPFDLIVNTSTTVGYRSIFNDIELVLQTIKK